MTRGEIPVPLRSNRDYRIRFARGQQTQAQGGGVDGVGVRAQRPQIRQPTRIADEAGAGNAVMCADRQRCAILARALPERGVIHHVRAGIIDRGGDGAARFHHGAGNDEFGLVLEKGARAVDGVDDKAAPAFQPGLVVGGFFGQPAIIGTRALQPFLQERV